MQKMNKYNAKIDVIQSDNVYNKGKSITEKSEILHLKEIVKGTFKLKAFNHSTETGPKWTVPRKSKVRQNIDGLEPR